MTITILSRRVLTAVPAFLTIVLLGAVLVSVPAQGYAAGAAIAGLVRSAATQAGLPGASVTLTGTTIGVSADTSGRYRIGDIPPGVYTLSFQSVGHEPLTMPEVVVDRDRTVHLDIELQPIAIETAPVVVTGTYFRKAPDAPTSVFQLDAEEVRRLPGSAGDLSRILNVLPSTARVSDRLNDLVVRGGSPFENGFNVDGIRVPNINHFPVQGSSAGPIGLLNTELIEDVRFYSGGFPVAFGDRLSSITDIRLREGRRDRFAGQADISVAGFGATLEGPLFSGRGGWLVSGRRSFFEAIEKPLDLDAVPEFEDIHAKISFDANRRDRLILLNIYAASATEWPEEVSEERGWAQYGDMAARQNTAGLVWQRLWSPAARTETSISYASIKYEDAWLFTRGRDTSRTNNNLEGALRVSSTSTIRPNDRHTITIGGECARRIDELDYHYDHNVGIIARPIPETRIERRFHTTTAALFASHTWSPSSRVSGTAGLRADHFCLTDRVLWAPRVSARVEVSPRLAVNAALGVFHQDLPMFILAQDDRNRNLRAPTAIHSVLGFDYALSDAASLTIEFYNKEYRHFPLEPKNPRRFVIDDAVTLEGFVPYEDLVDEGRAWARGVELLLQKRAGRGFNYLLSGSVFRSRYRDWYGEWHNRNHDNQYLLTAVIGYRPTERWTFSGRWNIAGGRPYTPFDAALSDWYGDGILDTLRTNGARDPAYHSLNLRVDGTFYIGGTRLVTYLSVWNVYNRENVWFHYWDETDDQEATFEQWRILPIAGIRYEF